MNNIERIQQLAGIKVTEQKEYDISKKYASVPPAELEAKKKELQAVKINSARASFKYKNAVEELAAIEAALKRHQENAVKEAEEKAATEAALLEKKDDDKESGKEDDKDDDKESDKKDDSEKEDDKDDESDEEEEDEDESDEEEDEDDDSDDEEDEEEKKICEANTSEHMTDAEKKKREDIVKGMKKNKSELKKKYGSRWKEVMYATATKNAMESVELEPIADVVARIMEKDLSPTKIEVDYQNGPVENYGELKTKVHVPAEVRKEINKRIKELKSAILRYDDKGYNDKSIKQQAVDCLEQILQDLSTGDVEGVKKAQIYFETLMSPLTDFFPPKLVNWLANALNPYVGNESA